VIKPGPDQPAQVQTTSYVLTNCHLPDGSWKQDSHAQPDETRLTARQQAATLIAIPKRLEVARG
jgi:hypothetical protein